MNTETISALINSLNVVSKDVTRFAICHALIEPVEASSNTVSITVTDGHKLAKVLVIDDLFGHLPNYGVMVLDESIKQLKALKIKRVDSFKVEKDAWTINGLRIPITSNKGNIFPDYRRIIPEHQDEDCITVRLNAESLVEMLKAIRANKNNNGVTLRIHKDTEKLKAIKVLVSGENPESFGVLMPMRK